MRNDRPRDSWGMPLTDRETEIMVLLHTGRTRQEAAEDLEIADTTLRTHVKSVFGKLGVRNTSGALFVLEQQKKLKLSQEIRAAAKRYKDSETVTSQETERTITALLVAFVGDPDVAAAVKEWWEER